MEMNKRQYICIFRSDSQDFALLGSNLIGVRRLAGLQ